MPTFHFVCQGCKAEFSMRLPFGAKQLPACTECASADVRKLIKPPTISFKGSGFYKTDSRPQPPVAPKAGTATDTVAKPAAPTTSASPTKNA